MQWFEVKGFEGSYIVNHDGSEVRSVTRKRWFGNALRTVPGQVIHRKYVLRSLFGYSSKGWKRLYVIARPK